MKVLVVGGAGYIGSHMVKMLLDAGYEVVTLDNLVAGYRDAVLGGEFIYGDIADYVMLNHLFSLHHFDAVMHFASHIQVGESVRDPAKYYRNNVTNTQNLLDAMVAQGIRHFIFSSSAAIFGEPHYTPVDEAHPKIPINPYGHSKLMVEQILADYDRAYGLTSVCLRYFNAAGAHPDCLLGERHNPETHLIPLILQVASGRREAVSVFGRDYPTADGTCIRDYIHIMDLCQAHLHALEQLMHGGTSAAYNLGNGDGFSVQQVINEARKVTGRKIKIIDAPRREGDPAELVADSTLAQKKLGWLPCYAELETIIRHAWQWECKQLGSHQSQD
ncbi:MAG: UDP-glucose 4-epimerase GalE [Gallionellales bacterium GWA2_60_142]|nr:MAG: UDP-glucose 4-epimerase GalE [Gallionellales bacterium GWA2_60_142]HCI12765.1 UDP-glucose 4-epimerase GalE [Gallionellaceae bacterium]